MRKLVKAVAIITVFAVITRALGFVLRIYMSRKLGAEILGYYQVAITIFGVFCTVISSGIPVIVSRSVSSAYAQNDLKKQNSIVSSALFISTVVSVLMCTIVVSFPNLFSFVFTSNKSTQILIWLLPGVVASAIYATFRGALWGQKRFFWISCSEFFEQLIRIVFIVILFEATPYLAPLGELAAISLSAACIVSAVLVAILYFCYKGKLSNPFASFGSVFKTSTPITTIRTASSLGTFLIAIIIPLRLISSGMTKESAMSLFGIASGMALPLIMIPSTLVGAVATAVIPEISANITDLKKLENNTSLSSVKNRMNTSFNIALIISFICVPTFLCLGKELGYFLFGSEEAGSYVSRASFIMVPICLSQISTSYLNAVGMENRSLLHYIVGSVALFVCIYFLPTLLGINALIVGMGALFTINSILNIAYLGKKRLLSKKHLTTASVLALYCIPVALVAKYGFQLFSLFCPFSISLIFAFGAASLLYIGLCLVFHQLSIEMFFTRRKVKRQV